MAVVAGLTIYEIGALACAGLALILASPPGQQATKEGAKAIGRAIDSVGEKADSPATTDAPPISTAECDDKTKEKDKEKEKECDPCPMPPPPQVHRDHPHGVCQDHWHYFKYNQNPETCVCYLQRLFGGCLGPDEEPPLSW
jgi:hypothetical protein